MQTGVDPIPEEPGDVVCVSRRAALACLVNSEVAAVLAVMRRNVRWGGRYMAGDDQSEHALVLSLKALRKQIFSWQQQWQTINPTTYIKPFLDVIRSDETGAPITGVALSSVYKILTLDVFDLNTMNVEDAMHMVVDAVTSCRFEVTDPASEEVVLMKILQVLLACMKSKASVLLTNKHVCTIVNTCFRVVHQAETKGELLQRIARHIIHELVRCTFSHFPSIVPSEHRLANWDGHTHKLEASVVSLEKDYGFENKDFDNGNGNFDPDAPPVSAPFPSNASVSSLFGIADDNTVGIANNVELSTDIEPYGIPCMVEIFHFLCSLLNLGEHIVGSRSNPLAFDEDVPLFALGLINSAIQLAGPSIRRHPKVLALVQDELFLNLMKFGLSVSPLILSMVCSIVLNLYQHLREELKLQLEAFFSCIVLRLTQSSYGASFQQQEVIMEALVDFCRQPTFMAEMYANLDCDITCSNVFEDLANLLSKSAFPVNCPLSAMHVLALEGLIAVIEAMTERIGSTPPVLGHPLVGDLKEYMPFWTAKCQNYSDYNQWVGFVRHTKFIKRKLMIGVNHFNRDPKKGLEFLQGTHLLPDKLDPQSVACFFRYTAGLDKSLVGDFLGNHDDFCVQVLHEFARTFDFQDMNLDTALRLFLETFRLPGEAQKIQRVLEAFSERYYEHNPHVLADKDAALVLSYSTILLNTDRHNVQVKAKMTEEDFIRNNRTINGGKDLPRDFLSALYHSICKNEIQTTPEQGAGFTEMTPSRWIDLLRNSKKTSPYIVYDLRAFLDHDMFPIMSGPTIAAISVVFEHAQHERVFSMCIEGFKAVAKISAFHHLEDVLNDLVVSLCKSTTLLNPLSTEEHDIAFSDDSKAQMATVAVFDIANRFGDYIRRGWRNILDCILRLHKLGLLPALVGSDAADDSEMSVDSGHVKPLSAAVSIPHMTPMGTSRRSAGLMGRFSQLLSLDVEEPRSQRTDQQLQAHQRTFQTIQSCHIDSIFTESKFLQADSLFHLASALMWAAGRPEKGNPSLEDEDTAVFCLDLLIAITLNNRDRIVLLWQGVYEHLTSIVQSTVMPCSLVEKAVFGLLRICQRLLPYKENLADELLKSLQLILKLDARVADAYCENISQEVMRLVKANASHIRSQPGWRTISSLLSITARHPEASDTGFEALTFIMADGAHLSPANLVLCLDAARQFAESRLGSTERPLRALDLMAESLPCLVKWQREAKETLDDPSEVSQDIMEMWLKLVQGLRRLSLEQREEVRNYALSLLQRCMMMVDGIEIAIDSWLHCFEQVLFSLLDDLLEITQGHSPKDYRNMESSLIIAMKLLAKVFLQLLSRLAPLPSFCKMWSGVLTRMGNYARAKVRGKWCEKLQEQVPELLKSMLLVMKGKGVLVRKSALGDDGLWDITWIHVNNIAPFLKAETFPDQEADGQTMDPESSSACQQHESVPEGILASEASCKQGGG